MRAKKYLIAIGIVVICIASISIAKDLVIKSMVTTAAARLTGTTVHMDGFSMNMLTSTIYITGFRIYNPGGFPEGILASCPKIKVIFDRASLFARKRHVFLMEIELHEMGLAGNKEGKLNVDALKITEQLDASPSLPLQIDLLTLRMGKIVCKDETIGADPGTRVYDINRQKSYKNISTAQQLALLVLAEPVKAAGIQRADICGVPRGKAVASLPDALAETFIEKDSLRQNINGSFEQVYAISLQEIKVIGKVTKTDALGGVIQAKISDAKVTLNIRKAQDSKIEITITARKFMLPQLDIAAWVLYQIIDTMQDTPENIKYENRAH